MCAAPEIEQACKRPLYRSDYRRFVLGQPLSPPGDHFGELTVKQQEAERLIREGHPNGSALRAENVYAFPDKARAEKYWAYQCLKYERYLYEIEVDERDILHSGDVAHYNHIVNNYLSVEEAKRFVERYWRSEPSENPDVENIVRNAVVKRVLGNFDDQKAALQKLRK